MEKRFALEDAMKATTVEELMQRAQENGVVLSMENAADLYADIHITSAELSDEAMEAVSSGALMSTKVRPPCHWSKVLIVTENGLPKFLLD